jgi:hypothetical protein
MEARVHPFCFSVVMKFIIIVHWLGRLCSFRASKAARGHYIRLIISLRASQCDEHCGTPCTCSGADAYLGPRWRVLGDQITAGTIDGIDVSERLVLNLAQTSSEQAEDWQVVILIDQGATPEQVQVLLKQFDERQGRSIADDHHMPVALRAVYLVPMRSFARRAGCWGVAEEVGFEPKTRARTSPGVFRRLCCAQKCCKSSLRIALVLLKSLVSASSVSFVKRLSPAVLLRPIELSSLKRRKLTHHKGSYDRATQVESKASEMA